MDHKPLPDSAEYIARLGNANYTIYTFKFQNENFNYI